MTTATPTSDRFLPYLLLTAILCGGLIMVIEVLGSRIIGPFFGVSLFVWTSLIAVTLIALATGYAVGGLLADRYPSADALYSIIITAALFTLLIPWLTTPVLALTLPLGLRAGAFVSTTLLFGPSLLLLGCVSPYLVKVATREMTNLGRTVGGFYALSTLGSVIGTVLTGFILIAYVSVSDIFYGIGTILLLIGIGYFALFRRSFPAATLLLILPLMGIAHDSDAISSKMMSNGTRVTRVAEVESFYGSLKVLDYSGGGNHTRELVIDGLIQGGIDMRDGLSAYPYPYFLELIPRALLPEGKTALVIGVGAGILPRWYQQQGITTAAVDIDPEVIGMARDWFNFDFSGELHIEDARYFLTSHETTYDYLLLDVFSGDITPGYLLSREAVSLFKRRLTEKGVLGINLVGSLIHEPLMTASVVKTLRSQFEQVEIYPTFDPAQGDGSGNIILMAYNGSPRQVNWQALKQGPINRFARKEVLDNLGRQFHFPATTPALILTDDYNPIDFYDSWLREKVRQQILASTDLEMLL